MRSVAGVLRGRDWWGSKLPPLLGLALVQVLRHDLEPGRALLLVVSVLFVTGASVGAWGHVLNDACEGHRCSDELRCTRIADVKDH